VLACCHHSSRPGVKGVFSSAPATPSLSFAYTSTLSTCTDVRVVCVHVCVFVCSVSVSVSVSVSKCGVGMSVCGAYIGVGVSVCGVRVCVSVCGMGMI
jgi:hypothetical protein